ncbi:MAG TPA: VOC family protein [Solirubrobacteraceae bacterium]|nr:VOC family protein [Solirubrobacteraceae bacterium]
MFAAVTISASDLDASRHFYETVLAAIGVAPDQWRELRLRAADDATPMTAGLHIAFVTRSRDQVDTFWQAGVGAGYPRDGDPGPRPIYGPGYYGGFLLDPDGNSVEAVFHGRERTGPAVIDHLWIGVSDLGASRSFWESLAPPLGLTLYGERPERFHVRDAHRSFALVADGRPATRNLTLAFPAPAGGAEIDLVDPDGTRVTTAR